jgi:hypothetical protein
MAREFSEIARADTVTVLVDGKRLSDLSARHNARAHSELIVQALVDGEALGAVRRLSMVLTKLDLVRAGKRAADTESTFDSMVKRMRQRFGGVFDDIAAFPIAASPTTSSVQRGHGVVALFEYWMQPRAIAPIEESAQVPERFFQRLTALRENPHD